MMSNSSLSSGFQSKRIETDVTRVVIGTHLTGLIRSKLGRGNEGNLGTVELEGADETNKKGPEEAGNLEEVADGRSRDLGVEEERGSLNLLSNEETDDGEHGNTSVGHLSLAVTKGGGIIGLLEESEGIEETGGGDGSRKRLLGESTQGRGALGDRGRGEGAH